MDEEVNCRVLSASTSYDLNEQIKKLGNDWEPVSGVSVAVSIYQAFTVTVFAQTMQRRFCIDTADDWIKVETEVPDFAGRY